MKIGIICATERELLPFGTVIKKRTYSKKALLTVCEGEVNGFPVAALYCGVCKVNAALATQILISVYGCDTIINSGTAGGLDSRLGVFSVVVATELTYHDVAKEILTEYHPWHASGFFSSEAVLLETAKRISEQRKDVFFGRMVTGEQFIDGEARETIKRRLSPLTVDMESAAIAHVCYANNVPFLTVRTLTDHADRGAEGDFQENCAEASRLSAELVAAIIAELGVSL